MAEQAPEGRAGTGPPAGRPMSARRPRRGAWRRRSPAPSAPGTRGRARRSDGSARRSARQAGWRKLSQLPAPISGQTARAFTRSQSAILRGPDTFPAIGRARLLRPPRATGLESGACPSPTRWPRRALTVTGAAVPIKSAQPPPLVRARREAPAAPGRRGEKHARGCLSRQRGTRGRARRRGCVSGSSRTNGHRRAGARCAGRRRRGPCHDGEKDAAYGVETLADRAGPSGDQQQHTIDDDPPTTAIHDRERRLPSYRSVRARVDACLDSAITFVDATQSGRPQPTMAAS